MNELSGDEAMEKSFAVGSLHSSMWRQKKANLFLSGITVMKSMVGVGILGLVNFFNYLSQMLLKTLESYQWPY